METFSALLAICAGNSPVTGEFPAQRPVTRSFDVLFDLRLNKRLSKQSWGWLFGTPSRPLWRHCNVREVPVMAVSVTCPSSQHENNRTMGIIEGLVPTMVYPSLTLWGRVAHTWTVIHWLKYWAVACSARGRYQNQNTRIFIKKWIWKYCRQNRGHWFQCFNALEIP